MKRWISLLWALICCMRYVRATGVREYMRYKNGWDYMGTLATTTEGKKCTPWVRNKGIYPVTDTVKFDPIADHNFPDISVEEARNHCRNPDRDERGLWCYTGYGDRWSFGFCSVPFCSGDVQGVRECMRYKNGWDYIGTLATTNEGMRCTPWVENKGVYPVTDTIKFDPITDHNFPDSSVEEARNYCRNPDRDERGLWCYTGYGDRWSFGFCSVPFCSGDVQECIDTTDGRDYAGLLSSTVDGKRCTPWSNNVGVYPLNEVTPVDPIRDANFPDGSVSGARNYCRNPDGDKRGLWCHTGYGNAYAHGFCSVPSCKTKDAVTTRPDVITSTLPDVTSSKRPDVTNECITPFGVKGICIEILECPQLLSKLRESQAGLRLVIESKCGAPHEKTKVCCLQKKDSLTDGTDNTEDLYSIKLPKACGETLPLRNAKRPGIEVRRSPKVRREVPGVPEVLHAVGGVDADIRSWTWAAILRIEGANDGGWSCGASLITKWYVLTAAHCVHSSTNGNRKVTVVRLGEYDLDEKVDAILTRGGIVTADPPQDHEPDEVIIHPQFGSVEGVIINDIALIRLKTPARFTDWVQPVCLPNPSTPLPSPNNLAYVIGWGRLGPFKPTSSVLQEVQVPIVSLGQCEDSYRSAVRSAVRLQESQHICAGGQPGKDSCEGDSGSALQIEDHDGRYIQYGIVSFGSKFCGANGIPGVYTNVKSFMPWILSNIKM